MEMHKTVANTYGSDKFSKNAELNEQMTIAPSPQDEYAAKAAEPGGRS